MQHPADLVLDANYAGPFGVDAEYFAPGADPVPEAGAPCRVMRGGDEAGLDVPGFNARPVIDTDTLRVRHSEIPAPAAGGAFLLYPDGRAVPGTARTYQINGRPERFDRHRREWSCDCLRLDLPGGSPDV